MKKIVEEMGEKIGKRKDIFIKERRWKREERRK